MAGASEPRERHLALYDQRLEMAPGKGMQSIVRTPRRCALAARALAALTQAQRRRQRQEQKLREEQGTPRRKPCEGGSLHTTVTTAVSQDALMCPGETTARQTVCIGPDLLRPPTLACLRLQGSCEQSMDRSTRRFTSVRVSDERSRFTASGRTKGFNVRTSMELASTCTGVFQKPGLQGVPCPWEIDPTRLPGFTQNLET